MIEPQDTRDVICAVDAARNIRFQAAQAALLYAGAAKSRTANLRHAWVAVKAALSRNGFEAPVLDIRDAQTVGPEPNENALWSQELRHSFLARNQRLSGELAQAHHAILESKAVSDALIQERDRSRTELANFEAEIMRLRHNAVLDREAQVTLEASLREAQESLARLASVIEASQEDAERLRRQVQEQQNLIESITAERDADRTAAASLSERLDDMRITLDQSVGPSISLDESEALKAKQLRLARTLHAHASKLDVESPKVSVIIPAYKHASMTLDCLQSIADTLDDGPTLQIIVVDDASPEDAVSKVASDLPYVTVLKNGRNVGFLHSCNRASQIATGRYLHFLNNDTIVSAGWVRELVACAESDERIGAVGSKLLFADGSLQEAGGIIWSDGNGWNYGRFDDPEDSRYNYVRDVDYLSGASLLVDAELFREIGRFDELYAPAYYEDTDLCFAIRNAGRRVVYQPKSVILHLEGISSGTSVESGVKRFQTINQAKFVQKWQPQLSKHFDADSVSIIVAARRLQNRRKLVILDSYVPEYDKDSGSIRLFNIIQIAQGLGFAVTFVPENYHRSEPYTTTLQNLGVEVLYGTDKRRDFHEAMRERLAIADVAWICRPNIAAKFMHVLREFSNLPVIYDTVDLHFLREQRELEHRSITDGTEWDQWANRRDHEIRVIRGAEAAVTVTDIERRILVEKGIDTVHVVPNVHKSYDRTVPFAGTAGVLFIGGYSHPPNVDAAVWLCEEIMPIVWSKLPHVHVTLIGSNPPPAVYDLESKSVRVLGYVPDVAPYFERTRLAVAPLRYGAGLKGKVGQAFSFGVPTVTTPIGAEGFDLVNGEDALIADDAAGIASGILRAYEDEILWQRLSASATRVVRRFSPEATRERVSAVLEAAIQRKTMFAPQR